VSDDSLEGARRKVRRAREHLRTLETETAAYAESEPFTFDGDIEAESGHLVFTVRFRDSIEVPQGLALVAGDAVHNLRSALDHLAWALASTGSGPGRWTQFPIMELRDSYVQNVDRLLEGVGLEHRAQIERLQPYHVRIAAEAGRPATEILEEFPYNTPLFLIARLDNMDKHRLLLRQVPVLAFRPPKLSNVWQATGTVSGSWIPLDEDGKEIYRITKIEGIDPDRPVEILEQPTWTLIVGEPTFDRAELWSNREKGAGSHTDLVQAADAVEAIIESFAADGQSEA
jgi:hypothetical protein